MTAGQLPVSPRRLVVYPIMQMTLGYTLSQETMRRGAALHYDHRLRAWRYVRLALAMVALGVGVYLLTAEFSRHPFLGAVMAAFGLVSCFRKPIFCRRTVRRFFKALDGPPEITVVMNEEGIDIQSKHSSGRTDWAGLVDYRVGDRGVLLYPQEGIFYWIPSDAEVDGGTWADVILCVQTHVQRKV